MTGHPDEYELARWATADAVVLREDRDDVLRPETAPPDASGADRPPSDAELIEAVRNGIIQAYGRLYERHVGAARSLARSGAEADDLVSDAFAKVLATLRAGGGPDSAFRAYLLTALRHTAYDKTRRDKRLKLADDVEAVSGVEKVVTVPFDDPVVAELERSLASRAFASLPERWRTVLWQTEIEGQSATEVAPLLGLTANGVSALAHRAREGLRRAYLQAHLSRDSTNRCQATVARLGTWTRDGLTKRETAQVETHLDECLDCRALAAELTDVNGTLRAFVAPLVLGAGTAGYLAATAGAAKAAGAGAAGTTGATAAANTVTSTQWLAVTASATAAVVAVVWGVNTGPQTVESTIGTPPSTAQADQQAPWTTSSVSVATSAAATSSSTSSGSTAPTTTAAGNAPSDPAAPETSTTLAAPAEPLAPIVPDRFTMSTGGPPTELPITIRNNTSTPAPAATLVLSLPEGVQVVGPGNITTDQTLGCPAGKGTVTCTAEREIPAGGSVTFLFRLHAGPKSESGTISGTVRSHSGKLVPVEVPLTITPKK